LIDVSALVSKESTLEQRQECAKEIDKACRDSGFFRIKGHAIPIEL
jgi:isopenicillin N synthase-like dioxygenase